MREAPLTAIKDGINRLRTRGGARADALYDLLNGYVTKERTVVVRPGTVRTDTLDSATKGLLSFQGSLHVFAPSVVTVPAGYILHVISHPSATSDNIIAITKIHFAKPFMGFVYVVAEFAGGDIFHFWLQVSGTWTANTVYKFGDVVQPTTPNGLLYKVTRLTAQSPSWAAGIPRAEGDVIEPTVFNNFTYTVVTTVGANPISGQIEPDWPTEDGAQISEDTDGVIKPPVVTTPLPDVPAVVDDILDRYHR